MSTATAKIPDNEIPDKELPDFSERRWQAVLDRAPLPDDPFVYAVRTTGIYCLPTCGSRRPNKPNVAFFATAEEAALAGFRACKRCRPDFQRNRQGDRRGDRARSDAIARACRRLETEEPEPSLPSLAAQAGLGPAAFRRLFRTHIGLSPKQYAKAARARRLAAALKTHPTVTGAIYEAGYGASSRGYEALEQRLGMAPSRYRHGAPGEVIRYAIARSVLGPILVAGTARGLCAVEFGDSKASLTDRLTQLFPHADRLPADAEFTGWLDTLLAFIDTPSAGMDLPLGVGPCGCPRLRHKRHRRRRALPPRGASGREPRRLSLGDRAQAQTAGAREQGTQGALKSFSGFANQTPCGPESPPP